MTAVALSRHAPEEESVERYTLSEQAYRRLRDSLLTGGLRPEQVLTVRGLADDYGVSLTPVREAIQRLVADGALTIENARTIRVPRLGLETYREILRIRLELEPMAARSAAAFMDDAEMDRLDEVATRHVESIRAGLAHETLTRNLEFHLSIYRASRLPVLVGIIESLYLRVGPTLNLLFPQYCGNLTGHELHLKVLDALRRRDGEEAARYIREDLATGAGFLLRLLRP